MPGKKKQLKIGMAQQSRAHGEEKAEEPCQTPNMNWMAEDGNNAHVDQTPFRDLAEAQV